VILIIIKKLVDKECLLKTKNNIIIKRTISISTRNKRPLKAKTPTNQNYRVPPILIQDAKEFKENPRLLKQAIEHDLQGIKIK